MEQARIAPPEEALAEAQGWARALAEAAGAVGAEDVVLVTTKGHPSMDSYALRLAEQLAVGRRHVDLGGTSAGLFNDPLLGARALFALGGDLRVVRLLRSETRLIHLPNHHLARYGCALNRPYVVTAHDLIRWFDARGLGPYISHPNLRHRIWIELDYRGIARAAAIIAPSHATKSDVVHHLGVPEERVHVVHMGVDHAVFRPREDPPLPDPYLLFVGTEHPRKNLLAALNALARLKAERRFAELKLVKVGSAGPREAPFRRATLTAARELELEDDVIFAGEIPPAELAAYYSGAVCTLLPSLYEGFGFPALEAMACGCAVIVSNVTSLPEIVADAGIQVAPHDIDGLRDAIEFLLSDPSAREELRRRGRERAKHFSWQRCAAETLAVYASVLDSFALASGSTAKPRSGAIRTRQASRELH